MTPGSCSTGIHILLEELELIFEVELVNLLAGDQKSASFLALNPKGTIPLLVTDEGRPISEFQAIAYWLARRYPRANLLGGDLDAEVRVLETMDYVVGTLHMQGFARIFTTEQFTPRADDHDAVQQQGHGIVKRGFEVIAAQLGERDYIADTFSIADAALFYTEFWADRLAIPLPAPCAAHLQRMCSRPAVRQVLAEEGYRLCRPERPNTALNQ